jgi:transcriptional regulator with XRE-family HTH domain
MAAESFGATLRRARLARGLALADLAQRTNVSMDHWTRLERGDCSRWPHGIYARAWVRTYANLVGLDPVATVNEFCQTFPQGERRAAPRFQEHAAIVNHQLEWHDDPLPPTGDRRAPESARERVRMRHPERLRGLAALVDAALVLLVGLFAIVLLGTSVWMSVALVAITYQIVSSTAIGCTPMVWMLDAYLSAHPERHPTALPLVVRRGPVMATPGTRRVTS